MDPFCYHTGFGNFFESEAVPGSLPLNCNSPRHVPFKLYAELISGTSQSAPRHENQCTWVYRVQPSVAACEWTTPTQALFPLATAGLDQITAQPTLLKPSPVPTTQEDFLASLRCLGGAGDALSQRGYRIYTFCVQLSMDRCAFCNADGSVAIFLHKGSLKIQTELGWLQLEVGEVLIVPRGISFRVLNSDSADPGQGMMLEVFDGLFVLPDQGMIGTSGLASSRDFRIPVAAYDKTEVESRTFIIYHKFGGVFHIREFKYSVFDVVAWRGTYTPYKYNLANFCAVNTVTYDHMDPCIGTLLTVRDDAKAFALSLICFAPQRRVAKKTFRPPNLHRNCLMEFLVVLRGVYEARPHLVPPGGATLHNTGTPHGPFPDVYERNLNATDEVLESIEENFSLMVEARLPMVLTQYAKRELNCFSYATSWSTFERFTAGLMEI